MTTPVITTGDDVAIPVTLKKKINGVLTTFTIDPAADVTAAVITTDRDNPVQLITDTVCDEGHADADWANSKVIVEFASAATGAVDQYGNALLEVQVDEGGKLTWFGAVEIKLGTVT